MAQVLTDMETLDVEFQAQKQLDIAVGSPMEHSRVLSITKNGKHVVSEYDLAEVDVHENPEEKTLIVTENGTYEILPTDNHSLRRVNLEVKVYPKVKPISISWRRDAEVTYVPGEMIDTSNMTSLLRMFEDCTKLEKVDVSEWNTSKVTSIERTFGGCASLKELDVSKWDTSNVTSLRFAFYNCKSLTKPLDVSKWNTSKLTDLYNIFSYYPCDTLDVSNWDTGNVINMQSVFGACSHLTALDLTGWNCEKNTVTDYFFHICSKLASVIGTHTLEEVETGGIVALKNMGAACANLHYQGATVLCYASLLALVNGMYDRTSTTTGTLRLSTTAFNNCKNDDDLIPDATTLAERQAKIRAICAEKNYILTLA